MNTPTTQLTRIRVEGFRSLKDVTVDLGPVNVLIGPNGAGKSNLLSTSSRRSSSQDSTISWTSSSTPPRARA